MNDVIRIDIGNHSDESIGRTGGRYGDELYIDIYLCIET